MSDKSLRPKPHAYSYVRFSRETQLRGNSLRRQKELSQGYAEANGLHLVEDFELEDLGVSAFKGANIETGALGRFLEAVRNREIEPGSYLLVESLDRLSRQEVQKALSLFLSLLNSGINIATVADGSLYKAGETDELQLMMSILVMSRAHEESKTKSKRLADAWDNKRNKIHEQKLTRRCPAWLRLSSDKQSFIQIPARVAVIQSIFEDSASGIGSYTIVRRLNEVGVETFGRSKGWQISYVEKILKNRAVLGEFQPHKLIGRRRPPEGQAIVNYFPSVISEDLFLRSQYQRELRRIGGGGRRGEYISNLFSGIAKCFYCKSPMHFLNKGPKPKGGTYLVCDAARRGLGCDLTLWRYDDFEASFLGFVRELDLEPLLQRDDSHQQRNALSKAIEVLNGRRADLTHKQDRLIELSFGNDISIDRLKTRLGQVQSELNNVEREINEKVQEQSLLQSEVSRFYESKIQIKELINRLQTRGDAESYKLRSQVASRLKSLVSALRLAPSGMAGFAHAAESPWKERFRGDSSPHRFFLAVLKNGASHTIFPDDSDPLQTIGHVHFYEEGTKVIDSGNPKAVKVPIGFLLGRKKPSKRQNTK